MLCFLKQSVALVDFIMCQEQEYLLYLGTIKWWVERLVYNWEIALLRTNDTQLKRKLIEFCCCGCDSSEQCIQPSADTHSGNRRTLTKTDERTISQQPIYLFSLVY